MGVQGTEEATGNRSVTAFSCVSSSTDQYIYCIPRAACVQHEDVLGTTLSTLFLGGLVKNYPQGDTIYRETFSVCPGGLWVTIPCGSQGILHLSRSGDSEEAPSRSRLAQSLLQARHQGCVSPDPLLPTSKGAWGMQAEEGDKKKQAK